MKRIIIGLVLGAIVSLSQGGAASAATVPSVVAPLVNFGAACQDGSIPFIGFQTWDALLKHDSGSCAPRLEDINDIWKIVFVIIDDLMKAAGYVAVGYIIWGAIKYIKSQGEPGEIQQARVIIYNALFGLILVFISVAIVTFVAGTFKST